MTTKKNRKKRLTHRSGVSHTSYDKGSTGTKHREINIRSALLTKLTQIERRINADEDLRKRLSAAITAYGQDLRGRKTNKER